MSTPVRNWGRTLEFTPGKLLYPKTEAEIQVIVREAGRQGRTVRTVGTAHSWTHLIHTPDVLISLDQMQGLVEVDREKLQPTLWAGTKLRYLGNLLRENNLAMENLGDIDEQSLAGAVSTGTHGTGLRWGVIASQAVELTLVTGTGELVTVTADSDYNLFRAAQVSLGMLGILTRIKLQCLPAYNLQRVKKREKLADALQNAYSYAQEHRNFEMYAFPYSQLVQTIFVNETTRTDYPNPTLKYLVDVVYENGTMKLISDLNRAVPSLSKPISQLVAGGIAVGEDVHMSHRVYASKRLVRFYEMEYGVPAEDGPRALKEILEFIEKDNIQVHFPIEYRYVKQDDIWLSPAYGRDTCFISCHMYQGMPHEAYFRGVERLMQGYDSRPHWGKMHNLTPEVLSQKYPQWGAFMALRQQLDPQGVFLNPYLRKLTGQGAAIGQPAHSA